MRSYGVSKGFIPMRSYAFCARSDGDRVPSYGHGLRMRLYGVRLRSYGVRMGYLNVRMGFVFIIKQTKKRLILYRKITLI